MAYGVVSKAPLRLNSHLNCPNLPSHIPSLSFGFLNAQKELKTSLSESQAFVTNKPEILSTCLLPQPMIMLIPSPWLYCSSQNISPSDTLFGICLDLLIFSLPISMSVEEIHFAHSTRPTITTAACVLEVLNKFSLGECRERF